ncbi:MAG: hypothetical protein ABJF10_17540 [Chthoniobacter sp.]|uniref:hypothetical protein n=1 Tax=Chthoniobacter sp. TaxID=2510640 RepID=UPI0032A8BB31
MSHKSSTFWVFALPVSLVILAAAYYIKIPSARRFIDAHTSLGHQLFGSFVHDTVIIETKPPKDDDPLSVTINERGTAANVKPAVPTPVPVFDLQKLARDPSHWPKKVMLKKATGFPAVVGGKVVGSLTAPVGAEANLKMIKDGKIGLEYQGGGALVPVEDTDLAVRAMAQ